VKEGEMKLEIDFNVCCSSLGLIIIPIATIIIYKIKKARKK
jgi:hypothetical protein